MSIFSENALERSNQAQGAVPMPPPNRANEYGVASVIKELLQETQRGYEIVTNLQCALGIASPDQAVKELSTESLVGILTGILTRVRATNNMQFDVLRHLQN